MTNPKARRSSSAPASARTARPLTAADVAAAGGDVVRAAFTAARLACPPVPGDPVGSANATGALARELARHYAATAARRG